MVKVTLVSEKLLSNRAFVRDLTFFLQLSEEALRAISDFGSQADGFVGQTQAQSLSSGFDVPTDQSMGSLRVAKYLYDRVAELRLDVADAVGQVDLIASGLSPSLALDDGQKKAIEAILSFKRSYEKTNASSKAVSNGPHFSDVNGAWSVTLLQISDGEVVRVPLMTLGLTWHDGAGDHHEVFLQMDDKDWEDFAEKVRRLTEGRKLLDELL